MNILPAGYFLLQITISYADNTGVVSDDERMDAGEDRRQDTVDFDSHRSNRRYNEGDDGAYDTHLENIDQERNRKCRQENFEEKLDKYRKPGLKDAGLIEFISSDALIGDEEDISPCKSINDTKDDSAAISNNNVTSLSPKKDSTSKVELNSNTTTKNNEALTPNTATTTNVKRVLSPDDTSNNAKAEKIRRSEYQFSSVEYYDDTKDFDVSKCPDAVEVIILQMDELRKYDVECETMIQWRSLE